MRSLAFAISATLAVAPGIASAAEPPCLTPAEFTSVATYGLPSVIKGAGARCAATLPTDAFLRTKAGALSDRYAQKKAEAWPGAKGVFLKMSTATNPQAADLIKSLPDTSLQPMVDGLVEGLVGQQLPTERCGIVDRLVRLLAPLPPESTAELIALAAGIGAKTGRAKFGSISLCSGN